MVAYAYKIYCPICKEFVYPIRHVYPDRVEYVCPKCGRVLEVVHGYGKWWVSNKSECEDVSEQRTYYDFPKTTDGRIW